MLHLVLFLNIITASWAYAIDEMPYAQYFGFGPMEIIKVQPDIRCLRCADFNLDGKPDLAVVNNRQSKIELYLQTDSDKSSPSLSKQINDLPSSSHFDNQPLLVTANVASMITGDFNGDKRPDIAFYGEPSALYIYLQKPSRDPNSQTIVWDTVKKIPVSDGAYFPESLACGDLNGDSKPDIVLIGKKSLFVFIQNDAELFSDPLEYPLLSPCQSVQLCDINGDLYNDIILSTQDKQNPLYICFGTQQGHIGPMVSYEIESPFFLQVISVNGTDDKIVLASEAASGRLAAYQSPDTDNKNNLRLYPLQDGSESKSRDLVCGDIDGNGLTDIVVSYGASARIDLYLQTSAGAFAEPQTFPALSQITNIKQTDINGDGKDELVMLSVKERSIGISGYVNGRLEFPKPVALDGDTGEPAAMDVADMDNDGNPDCVYVAKDKDDNRFLAFLYSINDVSTTKKITPVKLPKVQSNPEGILVFDADQNGLMDVLIMQQYDEPVLICQITSDTFEIIKTPGAQFGLIKSALPKNTSIKDMTGDEKPELLLCEQNYARSLYFRDGKNWQIADQYNAANRDDNIVAAGAFAIQDNPKSSIVLFDSKRQRLEILDISGDDNTYRKSKTYDIGKWNSSGKIKLFYESVGLQGRKQLIIFDGDKFGMLTINKNDNSTFSSLDKLFSYETGVKDGRYSAFAAGDLNKDGITDIAVVEYKKHHIDILSLPPHPASSGPVMATRFQIFEERTFSENQPPALAEPRQLLIADLNDDGFDDLAAVVHDRIIIYPQDK